VVTVEPLILEDGKLAAKLEEEYAKRTVKE